MENHRKESESRSVHVAGVTTFLAEVSGMLFSMRNQLLNPYSHCRPALSIMKVFWHEVPHGLPPLRAIEHQIDLIPSFPIPNRLAYRTNPEETKEIQKRFMKNFNSITAPLNELVKKDVVLNWDDVYEKAFNLLKDKLTNAFVLCLPNFDKAFEIECDASGVGIGVESKPIAYFSEKLSGAALNYSTYDKELYALLQKRHAKWLEFIEMFPYVIKYKKEFNAKVRANIEKRNEQYSRQANKGHVKVTFEPGDGVWVHMQKERFPIQINSKLKLRGDEPFQVLERINDNAYKLDLPTTYGEEFDSRTNPFERGENDRDLTNKAKDNLRDTRCPMTRSKTKMMKQSLPGLSLGIKESLEQSESKATPKWVTLSQVDDD
ncbi:Tf2-11, partial [Mucuna pruriens]